MQNNLEYLYSQLNEVNSKIGNIYNYIDNNTLTDFKIKELYFKADNYCSRADKIQSKIDLIENQKAESRIYLILLIIDIILVTLIVMLAILLI